ncbi:MAG: hypothetical protein ACYSUF_04225 [Planctomycetota bacterium]
MPSLTESSGGSSGRHHAHQRGHEHGAVDQQRHHQPQEKQAG